MRSPRRRVVLLGVAAGLLLLALLAAVRARRADPASRAEPIWVVDAGFATQYPQAVAAIEQAGGQVRVFDFPGASLPGGKRYPWVRDYGPLATLSSAKRPWMVWDAWSRGSATPVLESVALVRLAEILGAQHRPLDVTVQGGNWLPLPDGRVITTSRFFADNGALGAREEIERHVVRETGIAGLIEIAPLAGELTQHADMVAAVDSRSGAVFVGDVWQEALDRIPSGSDWDMYRGIATAMRASLEDSARDLRSALGDDRVRRFPQPLPYLDPHRTDDRYRPCFPSFVNGIFVTDQRGATTYLYGLAGDPAEEHYYSFDAPLLERYVAEMERVARAHGFAQRGVQTGDLIRSGGSLHCATVECYLYSRRAKGR